MLMLTWRVCSLLYLKLTFKHVYNPTLGLNICCPTSCSTGGGVLCSVSEDEAFRTIWTSGLYWRGACCPDVDRSLRLTWTQLKWQMKRFCCWLNGPVRTRRCDSDVTQSNIRQVSVLTDGLVLLMHAGTQSCFKLTSDQQNRIMWSTKMYFCF